MRSQAIKSEDGSEQVLLPPNISTWTIPREKVVLLSYILLQRKGKTQQGGEVTHTSRTSVPSRGYDRGGLRYFMGVGKGPSLNVWQKGGGWDKEKFFIRNDGGAKLPFVREF